MQRKHYWLLGLTLILGLSIGLIIYLNRIRETAELRSPYVSQLDSSVRGLSAQEVDDLLNGRGAGYARSAELNGYPGPRHVLDMRQELALSPEVSAELQVIFDQMEGQARQLGQEIIHRESQLSQGFASDSLSETDMRVQVEELARLYSDLRAAHLQAHFQTKQRLTPEQVLTYNELRGYLDSSNPSNGGDHQHNMKHMN